MKPLFLVTIRMDICGPEVTSTSHKTHLSPISPAAWHKELVMQDRLDRSSPPISGKPLIITRSIIMAAEVTPEEAKLLGFDENGNLPE